MYMDKNKGFSLTEVIFTTLLFSLIFQNLYLYTSTLNKEKSGYLKKIMVKENSELLFIKIQNSMYESLTYKIYKENNLGKIIDFSKPTELEGNSLIIEKYLTEEKSVAEIYYFDENYMTSMKGEIKNKVIIVEQDSKQKILRKINCKIYLEEYGISIRGRFLNENFKKEIKK